LQPSGKHSRRRLVGFTVLSYAVMAALLALIAVYLWSNRSSLWAAWQVPTYLWLIPFIIYFCTVVAKGLSFDLLASLYGVRVPFFDSVGLTAAALLSNYAAPGNMSIPLRTAYLHRVLGLHYKDFLPLVLAVFVFSTGIYGLLAGAAASIDGQFPSSMYAGAVLLFGAGGLGLVIAMCLPYRWLPILGHRIEAWLAGWRRLHRSPRHFTVWLGMVILLAACEVTFFYSILWLLDVKLTFLQTAVMVLAKECSVFLRITPGAFGVSEGVQVFFGAAFGVDVGSILLAAVIARVVELVCLGMIAAPFFRRLGPRLAAAGEQTRPVAPRLSV
jgi:uncharacterized membrane protein YbhN (UPF0104 family)